MNKAKVYISSHYCSLSLLESKHCIYHTPVRKELERGPDEEVYHITSTESYDQDTTDSGGMCSNLPLVPIWARSVIEPLLLQISMNSAVTLILPIPVFPVLLFI